MTLPQDKTVCRLKGSFGFVCPPVKSCFLSPTCHACNCQEAKGNHHADWFLGGRCCWSSVSAASAFGKSVDAKDEERPPTDSRLLKRQLQFIFGLNTADLRAQWQG